MAPLLVPVLSSWFACVELPTRAWAYLVCGVDDSSVFVDWLDESSLLLCRLRSLSPLVPRLPLSSVSVVSCSSRTYAHID